MDLINEIENGFAKGACSTIVMRKRLGENDMRKGRGANVNPYFGRVEKVTTYSGYVMGTDYLTSIVNAAVRSGNDVSKKDVRLKKTWHTRFDEWFNVDKATQSKYYLKLQANEKQVAHSIKSVYYLDGIEVSKEMFKEWLKEYKSEQSSTQTEIGLDKSNEQHYNLVAVSNIKTIKQGNKVLNVEELLRVTC